MKVEEGLDIGEEENPLALTFSGIKAEHEVSCMSVCVCCQADCTYMYPELCIVFIHLHLSVCLSVRPYKTNCLWKMDFEGLV
jgi:hypothetical protein